MTLKSICKGLAEFRKKFDQLSPCNSGKPITILLPVYFHDLVLVATLAPLATV